MLRFISVLTNSIELEDYYQHIVFDIDYENNDEGCDEAENEESDQANFRFLCIKFM